MRRSNLFSSGKYLYIIVVAYLIIGSVWILFSDELFPGFDTDPAEMTQLASLIFIATAAMLLCVLVNNTFKKMKRVDEHTHKLNLRQQAAESLSEVLCVLNSNRPLSEIMECIVLQTGRVLGADAAAIYRLNPQEDMLSIQSCQGLEADYSDLANIPLGQAVTGQAAQENRPVTVTDLTSELQNDFLPLDEQRKELLQRLAVHYRALMAVPLVIKSGDLYGTLTLYYHSPREFSDADIELAVFFSDQASLAIDNARLRDQVERSAIVAERSRLARELHDSVTQSLYSVTLYSDAALIALSNDKRDVVIEHLQELRSIGREAMLDMRLLIFELHPLKLEQEGLVAAVQARLEAVEERSGMQVDLEVENEKRLANNIEMDLYRIIQEALTNVVKHAKATHVLIHLQFSESDFTLSVKDNGIGFDPAIADQQGGFGLSGITERVHQLGGNLVIDSGPGRGTALRVEIDIA